MKYGWIFKKAAFWIGFVNILLLIAELSTTSKSANGNLTRVWEEWEGYTMLFGSLVSIERIGVLLQSGLYARIFLSERCRFGIILSLIGNLLVAAMLYSCLLFAFECLLVSIASENDGPGDMLNGYALTTLLHSLADILFQCLHCLPLLLLTNGRFAILVFFFTSLSDTLFAKLAILLLGEGVGREVGWYLPSGVMSRFLQAPLESGYIGYVYTYIAIFMILSYLIAPVLKRPKSYAR